MAVGGCSIPFPATGGDRMPSAATLTVRFWLSHFLLSAPYVRSVGPGKAVSCWLIPACYSGTRCCSTLREEGTWLSFPKTLANVLCLPGHSSKSEVVGPCQKSEGILPLRITVWRLNVMKLKMTKLVTLGYFLRMLPSLGWTCSQGFVSFMH